MTDVNLSAAPYAYRLATGYNDEGDPYDIEVLSMATFDLVEGMEPEDFRAWCAANDVFYYARPREDFSEARALDMAANAMAKYILMEDLS